MVWSARSNFIFFLIIFSLIWINLCRRIATAITSKKKRRVWGREWKTTINNQIMKRSSLIVVFLPYALDVSFAAQVRKSWLVLIINQKKNARSLEPHVWSVFDIITNHRPNELMKPNQTISCWARKRESENIFISSFFLFQINSIQCVFFP